MANGFPFAFRVLRLEIDHRKAAQADAATGGAADAKSVAETAIEDTVFVLARAPVMARWT